jgi:hypothetical protein
MNKKFLKRYVSIDDYTNRFMEISIFLRSKGNFSRNSAGIHNKITERKRKKILKQSYHPEFQSIDSDKPYNI